MWLLAQRTSFVLVLPLPDRPMLVPHTSLLALHTSWPALRMWSLAQRKLLVPVLRMWPLAQRKLLVLAQRR
jgi:hypothetical protein